MPADLVLLHGFTQTGASWDGVVRELAGRYRALAPDLGAGPWEAELDRLEALAPPAFALAGYSMGGRLALALALRIPERVTRLVLVSASPGLADDGERAARRDADEALAERIEAIGAEAFAREWAAQPLFAGQPPEVAAAAHADRLRRGAAEHAAQLRGLGTGVMPPLWDRLGELTMPVTLVVGERDAKFRAIAERMGCAGRGRPGRRPRRPPRGAGRGRGGHRVSACPGSSATTSSPTPSASVPLLSRDPAAYTDRPVDHRHAARRAPLRRRADVLRLAGGGRRGARRDQPHAAATTSCSPSSPTSSALVAALREHGAEVPGVNGEVETVERFAAAWTAGDASARRRTCSQLRLFALGSSSRRPAAPRPPARRGRRDDLELAMRWFDAFTEELELPEPMPESRVRAADRGSGCSRCGRTGRHAGGARAAHAAAAGVARIDSVYTPPEQRGRRYGGAITAACCADALARERRARRAVHRPRNPAPNKVYQRIGFRPVSDHRVTHFA